MKKTVMVGLSILFGLTTMGMANNNYMGENTKDDFYLQYGVSFSDSDDTLVECRGSLVAVGGYNLNQYLGIEGRYTYGLGGHYDSYGAYLKPQYKDLNFLVGYGHTNYLDHNISFDGARIGVGYLLIDKITVDVIHKLEEKDTTLSVLWNYKF